MRVIDLKIRIQVRFVFDVWRFWEGGPSDCHNTGPRRSLPPRNILDKNTPESKIIFTVAFSSGLLILMLLPRLLPSQLAKSGQLPEATLPPQVSKWSCFLKTHSWIDDMGSRNDFRRCPQYFLIEPNSATALIHQ